MALTSTFQVKMKLIHLFQLVSVFTLLTVTISTGERFDEEDDCCQLDWTPIIEAGHKRFIPADAIIGGRDANGTNWYYIRKETRSETGIISDVVTKPALFFRREDRIITEDTWSGGLILTNPNHCVLGYKRRERSTVIFDETMQIQFPKIKGRGFAYEHSIISNDDDGIAKSVGISWEEDSTSFKYYGITLSTRTWTQVSANENNLYVDCKESLLNQLSAELYDIDIDLKQLIDSSDHQTVSTTEVINDGDVEQFANVSLTADITSAIEMRHDTQLKTVSETKWGVHGSANLKFVENFLFVKASQDLSVSGGYDSQTLKSNFTREGTIRYDSTKTTYKFNQSVRMKPKSKSKIVIKTKPVQGSQKFTAYYKISPKTVSLKSWTPKRILNILKRIGFTDYIRIREVNNTLILTYDGYMSVNSGFDTHVLIESKLLNETDPGDGKEEKNLTPYL